MNKILTIKIADYNDKKIIKKTLDSLLIDEIEKLEIIVVNDGSTDKTKEIVEKYVSKYPNSIKIINKKNGGYGSTINTSIKLAKGKYFKQLDGDDWYNTQNLQLLLKKLEEIDVDMVYTPVVVVYEDSQKQEKREVVLLKNKEQYSSLEKILKITSKTIGMHYLLYKTELLNKNNIRCIEKCFYTDTEYAAYPFLYAESIFLFNKPIYYYRVGREGQSVSIEGLRKHYKDIIKVLDKIIDEYRSIELCLNLEVKEYYKKIIKDVINFLLNALILLTSNNENFKVINIEIKKIKEKYKELYKETMNNRNFFSKVVYYNFYKNYLYYKILKFIFDRKNKIKN